MSKPVILTGLRANNDLHIGNYFGALQTIVKLQEHFAGEYQINLFIPDLHSFTTPIDHSKLQNQIFHNLRLFAAAGLDLDNPDTYIYRQSYIPAHSELTVILNNFAYMGELSRMTQYKDKSSEKSNVSVGLFDYPVLMAADILLYGTTHVPVGEDQSQHVELARDIAERLNNKFEDNLFVVPSLLGTYSQVKANEKPISIRIRDLVNPAKKMSKSDESAKGVIFLGEDPEGAANKIKAATTDSQAKIQFDMRNQPGISNLLNILAKLEGVAVAEVADRYKEEASYGRLKEEVADAMKIFLKDFQKAYDQVDMKSINTKLASSEADMNKKANETLLKVQKAVGLR
ncbi:MAG TPA: tryptophan--tRNA ligase [Patescibacteria group bacterium]|nr:tryptophan--tRNA ligase [Patescibacteria group bacterium]